jgi:hypothetical protein
MEQVPPPEPSQEVLDFLKEEMQLRFPLVQDQRPAVITVRIQPGRVFVDVLAETGEWIMSSETGEGELATLEEAVKDPELCAWLLARVADNVAKGRSARGGW